MVKETIKNLFFCFSNIALIAASIRHTDLLTSYPDKAEEIYPTPYFGIVLTCLFVNLILFIFAMLILGNLNDFILHRCLNLIGACQKLKIVSVEFLI